MTTYSDSLKLALIGDGEQTNVWGATTNTNLGTLIEQAVVGVTTIAMTGSADRVLTNLNGASDEARNAVLVITGASSGGYSVILPAGQQKTYIVTNSLTTGSVNIKPSGGTAATIPNGTTMTIYTNGTSTQAVNYVEVAGTALTVTNLPNGAAGYIPYQSAPNNTVYLVPGTAGYVLTTAGAGLPPYWNPSGTSALASNLAGGAAGQIPYQTGANTTGFTLTGSTGQILTSNGTSPPSWVSGVPTTINGLVAGNGTSFGLANAANVTTALGYTPATTGANTFTGLNTFSNSAGTGTPIKGVTDGSSAAPGYVGELISSTASAVPAPNNVATNVAQISLSAGDWDIWGSTDCNNNPGIVAYLSSISTTSATIQSSGGIYLNGGNTMGPLAQSAPQYTVNFSGANRTYYLVVFAAYTGTTAQVNGSIYARRRR
jgi:hypothetical protein